ncbi:MAG: hypothetical protein JNM34_09080 [Chthonomonadaceae bacterium]|nr:hypothetical protein [Chthonomonadaceae bacterium]
MTSLLFSLVLKSVVGHSIWTDPTEAVVRFSDTLGLACSGPELVIGPENSLDSDGRVTTCLQSRNGQSWTFDVTNNYVSSYIDNTYEENIDWAKSGKPVLFRGREELSAKALNIAKSLHPQKKWLVSDVIVVDDLVRFADGFDGDITKATWLSVLVTEDFGFPAGAVQNGVLVAFHVGTGKLVWFQQNWGGVFEKPNIQVSQEEASRAAQETVATYIEGSYQKVFKKLLYVIPNESFGSKFPEQKGNPKHLRLVYWFQFGKNQVNVYIDAETGEVAGGDFRRDVRYKKL